VSSSSPVISQNSNTSVPSTILPPPQLPIGGRNIHSHSSISVLSKVAAFSTPKLISQPISQVPTQQVSQTSVASVVRQLSQPSIQSSSQPHLQPPPQHSSQSIPKPTGRLNLAPFSQSSSHSSAPNITPAVFPVRSQSSLSLINSSDKKTSFANLIDKIKFFFFF
jgi:hypothetical protein